MLLTYENKNNGISVECKTSVHVPPHLHEAVEMVYITSGTVELGVGQELYHMETGDFAVVFPNVIHHYQVFGSGKNTGIYLLFEPAMMPLYYDELQKYCPQYPVIHKQN
ncbi:MAG: cupin domain-containing protein, partial [Lachnospiraceae bacterium]|nr:cupin domain-containing protein [Lachnospiraceae bacterium]